MGRGIAQLAIVSGIETRLYDVAPGAAEAACEFVARMLRRSVDKGKMSAADADGAIARMSAVERLEDLAGSHVVIEAIVENLDAKRSVFVELERVVGDGCILATNTSSLSVTAIAAACRLPERVGGFHVFNPAPLMKLVEVVGGARTRADVCDGLCALATRFGHRPVRVKDMPGFLVNHAGRGYGPEALRILGEGVADCGDIDRVMRDAAGFKMGPFELYDLTGLDVSHPVMESIYHQFYEEPRFRPSPETALRVAGGLLGRKAGQGFYRYSDGQRKRRRNQCRHPPGRIPYGRVGPYPRGISGSVRFLLPCRDHPWSKRHRGPPIRRFASSHRSETTRVRRRVTRGSIPDGRLRSTCSWN